MAWLGMNPKTGTAVTDADHIAQSITDVLMTPIGSRVMRRSYGSHIVHLLDSPLNAATLMRLRVAIVSALLVWEPRIAISRVDFANPTAAGGLAATIEYQRTDISGAAGSVTVPLSTAA